MKNLLADVDEDNTVRKEPSSASDEVIVPEALQKKNRVTIGLMSKLKQEKCDRLIKTGANSNGHFNSNSRFRGVYLKPINSSTMLGNNNFQCRSAVIAAQVSPSGDEDKAAKKVYKPTSLVVSNPFASIGATAPQAKMKLNKRNLTFSVSVVQF